MEVVINYSFQLSNDDGRSFIKRPFEGIIPWENRYQDRIGNGA